MHQPCLSSGRDTAAGTALFSARKRGRDLESGEEGFLCQACLEGSAVVPPDQSIPLSGRFVVIDLPGGLPGN
ncbi:MAG TPA: hypothetical protein VF364_06220 [Candidatus Limnocylindria bacterium]